jgi:hypothetical protein
VEHVNQIPFYLNVLGIDSGSIDYLNKLGFLHGKDVIDKRFQIQVIRVCIKCLLGELTIYLGLMADIPPPGRKMLEMRRILFVL